MKIIDLLVFAAESNLNLLNMTIADFSDADMLVRPCPTANHSAWQLGHLAVSEANMVRECFKGSAMPELPAEFSGKFKRETAAIDDPAAFPKKKELLDTIARVRAGSVSWIRSLTEEDLERPTPERMREFAPNVGKFALMISDHTMMHLGQFQVVRRKLGKPIRF